MKAILKEEENNYTCKRRKNKCMPEDSVDHIDFEELSKRAILINHMQKQAHDMLTLYNVCFIYIQYFSKSANNFLCESE